MDAIHEIVSHPTFNFLLVIDIMREIQEIVKKYRLTVKNTDDSHYLECPSLLFEGDTVDSCVCDIVNMKRVRALTLLDSNTLW